MKKGVKRTEPGVLDAFVKENLGASYTSIVQEAKRLAKIAPKNVFSSWESIKQAILRIRKKSNKQEHKKSPQKSTVQSRGRVRAYTIPELITRIESIEALTLLEGKAAELYNVSQGLRFKDKLLGVSIKKILKNIERLKSKEIKPLLQTIRIEHRESLTKDVARDFLKETKRAHRKQVAIKK